MPLIFRWKIIVIVSYQTMKYKFNYTSLVKFLNFYRTQVNLGSDSWVRLSVTHSCCADLTDVTLADEDSNSIPTDDVNRAILGNVAMQVAPSDGQH